MTVLGKGSSMCMWVGGTRDLRATAGCQVTAAPQLRGKNLLESLFIPGDTVKITLDQLPLVERLVQISAQLNLSLNPKGHLLI